jgi:hypothetical protein
MSDENHNILAPAFGPAVMRAIGRELGAMYADIIAEEVRERWPDEPSGGLDFARWIAETYGGRCPHSL